MLKMTSMAIAASLLIVGGCDKKAEEGTVQKATEATGAAPAPAPQAAPPKPLTGTELADRYKACVEKINAAAWDAFKAECVEPTFQVHMGDGRPRTLDETLGFFQAMKAGMPDWKLTPQFIMVNGRNILAIELVTGTHTAPLKTPMGELPASNKKIGYLMFHRIATTDANKASEEWGYMDSGTMLAQLGAAPKDAPPKRPAMDKGIEGAPIVVVTADDAKEKANLEVARKMVAAVNANKLADMLALLQPDVVESYAGDPKDLTGVKEVEKAGKDMMKVFKDVKIAVDNEYAAGDYVVNLGTFTGTDVGLKKTGKQITIPFADVILFKDGKESRLWHFHDDMLVAQQLGLVPAAGAPATPPAAGSAAAPAAGSAAAPAAGSAAAPAAGSAAAPVTK